MRIRTLCALLVALLPVAVIASLAPGAQAAVAVPPALQALEQKMEGLNVSTERFSTKYEIATPSLKEGGFSFGLAYGISGEATLSPLQANLTVNVAGKHTPERLVGETLYVYEPRLSHLDKGRPWVRIEHETLQKVIQFDPSGNPQSKGASTEARGAFSNLLSILQGALSVKQVGPTKVDGQAVTEFTASLSPQVLLGVFTQQEINELKLLGRPSVELLVYLSEAGLPVRTTLELRINGIGVSASVDITGTNQPVAVTAPAISETITQAQRRSLLKLEGNATVKGKITHPKGKHGKGAKGGKGHKGKGKTGRKH
jgi:hypothetical protein